MKNYIKKCILSSRVAFLSISTFLMLLLSSCGNIIDAFSGASKPMQTDGNSLFHQTDVSDAQTGTLEVMGEVKKPGMVDFDDFYTREVYVKDMQFNVGGDSCIGAYRYIGYSLFDLLHPFNQDKKSAELFKPLTDMYIVVENDNDEHVVFSWSEIFHVNNPHQVIVATAGAPIEPHRKEVDYPALNTWKVVAGNDLYNYRSLENPCRIKVVSFDKKSYTIEKGMEPMYSPTVLVTMDDKKLMNIPEISDTTFFIKYNTCFYGMGMGYHPSGIFSGPGLHDLLKDSINIQSKDLMQHGLVCCVGLDGYRAVYSYSELFNRTDQTQAILSVVKDKMDGGYYRLFHPSDFYADRSVKGLKEIYIFRE